MENLKFLKPNSTKLTLGGKEYFLAYDLNSFAYLEEEYGGIDKAFEKLQSGNLKVKDILMFVKAGLASNEEEISLKDIGSCLDIQNIGQVVDAVNKAILASLPTDTQTKKSKN